MFDDTRAAPRSQGGTFLVSSAVEHAQLALLGCGQEPLGKWDEHMFINPKW
jgi:hypothetical protein